jgi:hypothetical protein
MMKQHARILVLATLLGFGPAAADEPARPVLGEVLEVDELGTLYDTGRTVSDAERVVTMSEPMVVRLEGGWMLRFEPSSAARFFSAGEAVEVRVLAGLVRAKNPDGRMHRVGGGARVLLSPSLVPVDDHRWDPDALTRPTTRGDEGD